MKDEHFREIYEKGVKHHRKDLSSDERALTLHHTIDPGFVNQRLVQSVIGDRGTSVIDDLIRQLPEMPDWMRSDPPLRPFAIRSSVHNASDSRSGFELILGHRVGMRSSYDGVRSTRLFLPARPIIIEPTDAASLRRSQSSPLN
jgi:hypothetical protein